MKKTTDSFKPKGFFKCRDSSKFLNLSNVCDGIVDCLKGSDELFCLNETFPKFNCFNENRNELICENLTNFNGFLLNRKKLKLIKFNQSEPPTENVQYQLTFLHIEASLLKNERFFFNFPNLVILKLRENLILNEKLLEKKKLKILQFLDLSHSTIKSLSFLKNLTDESLIELDVSFTKIINILKRDVEHLIKLKMFRITNCNLKIIELKNLLNLREIHLNKTNFQISQLFQIHISSKNLEKFFSQSFQLCCILKKYFGNEFVCQPKSSFFKSCTKMIASIIWETIFLILGVFGLILGFLSINFIKDINFPIKIFVLLLIFFDLFPFFHILTLLLMNRILKDNYNNPKNLWEKTAFCQFLGSFFYLSFTFSNEILFILILKISSAFYLKRILIENFLKSIIPVFIVINVFPVYVSLSLKVLFC